MDSELKQDIKNDINLFCKNLLGYNDNLMINNPVVITIYLGQESYEKINAPLEGAFTSSFSVEPCYQGIVIDKDNNSSDYIVNQIASSITEISRLGKSYDDIRLIFVTLMHDDLYDQPCIDIVDHIKTALNDLSYYSLYLDKIALYGLFDQKHLKDHDYQYAFDFITKGKDVWKNIYHCEVPFTQNDYNLSSQLIALYAIGDKYDNNQNGEDDYSWESLSLHYLRIPEMFTTMILHEIYRKQLDGDNVNKNEWKENITGKLNACFDRLFDFDEGDIYHYVPLTYQTSPKSNKKGLFSRFSKNEEAPVYHNILIDNEELKDLCEEVYGEIDLDEDQYKQLLKEMICSSTSIVRNTTDMENMLIDILEKEKEEYVYELNNNEYIKSETISNVNRYLKESYELEKKKVILSKKIVIVDKMIKMIRDSDIIGDLIHEISAKNNEYMRILKELCINEYGGIMDGIGAYQLPVFNVNKSVKEVLESIDSKMVAQVINEPSTVLPKLETFLSRTLNNDRRSHSLGEINGQYNHINPIQYVFLMTPSLVNNKEYNKILDQYTYLLKDVNALYRESSFYIISLRAYDSSHYIVRYKRGK